MGIYKIKFRENFSNYDNDSLDFNKFLICTPDITNKLEENFFKNSIYDSESMTEILSKFQLTNLINKEFLIIFNCNPEDLYSEIIIVKNLNILINLIINNNTPIPNNNHTNTEKNNSFFISIVNVTCKDENQSYVISKDTKRKNIDLDETLKYKFKIIKKNYFSGF